MEIGKLLFVLVVVLVFVDTSVFPKEPSRYTSGFHPDNASATASLTALSSALSENSKG